MSNRGKTDSVGDSIKDDFRSTDKVNTSQENLDEEIKVDSSNIESSAISVEELGGISNSFGDSLM